MAEKNGIYRCNICGNVVGVIEARDGELVCCGEPMELLPEHYSESEGMEKHVPVIEINGVDVVVTVGSTDHPMEDKHYIQLIQIFNSGMLVAAKRLGPGDKPQAHFRVENKGEIKARALCNIHGLWVSKR